MGRGKGNKSPSEKRYASQAGKKTTNYQNFSLKLRARKKGGGGGGEFRAPRRVERRWEKPEGGLTVERVTQNNCSPLPSRKKRGEGKKDHYNVFPSNYVIFERKRRPEERTATPGSPKCLTRKESLKWQRRDTNSAKLYMDSGRAAKPQTTRRKR